MPGNRSVLYTLLRWTILMFTAPFVAYYVSVTYMQKSAMWAGIAAIGVVQIVIVGYVAMAFTEDLEVDQEPEDKRKAQ